jgi:predicted nucleotidyltransferase
LALDEHRTAVVAMIEAAGGGNVRVFGSVARNRDTATSDVDLLATLPDDITLLQLVDLEQRMADLLEVPVDLVDDRSAGRVRDRIAATAVPL